MEHLEGSALLEEAQHLGLALRVCGLTPFPVCFLGLLCKNESVIFQVPGPGFCHAFFTIKGLISENVRQNKLLSWYLNTATKTKPIQSPAEILPNSQQDSYAVEIYINAKDLKQTK